MKLQDEREAVALEVRARRSACYAKRKTPLAGGSELRRPADTLGRLHPEGVVLDEQSAATLRARLGREDDYATGSAHCQGGILSRTPQRDSRPTWAKRLITWTAAALLRHDHTSEPPAPATAKSLT